MIGECWECGAVGDIHDHHPVPRSRGGTRTIPLCEDCHGKAHHRDKAMSTSATTREALAQKKARWERTGAVPVGSRVAADGRTLEADPVEAEIVAAVVKARAAELAAAGMRTRKGGEIQSTQVARTCGDWAHRDPGGEIERRLIIYYCRAELVALH